MFSALGWMGTAVYLISHAYLGHSRQPRRIHYYLSNLVAAVLLVVSSAALASWQAVVINAIWALISLMGLRNRHLRVFNLSPGVLSWSTALLFLLGIALLAYRPLWSIEVLAWSSALAFSLSYYLFSLKRISLRRYMLFSIYAPLCITPELIEDTNWPALCLELAWALISAYTLIAGRKTVELV